MEGRSVSDVYVECSGIPVPVSAHITEQRLNENIVFTVNTEWSQTDLVRSSRLSYSQQWTLIADSNDHKTIRSTLPGPCVPLQNELLSSYSPIQGLRAVVTETSGHQLLEIWDDRGLKKCLNLTALRQHGRVYRDAHFGCLSWSRCESKLLYVAEKSRPTSAALNGECFHKDRSVYCEDWGEGLSGQSAPQVCVVDVETGSVSLPPGVPPEVSPGQALWAPDGSIMFVGWSHQPFRLGLQFCSNRRSTLFRLDLQGNCECVSEEDVSVSSPRLSPDGTALVYLQGAVFGPHRQCLKLQQCDLESRKTSTLLDVVRRPQSGEFAGVYEALPGYCWSADSQRVLFSSACRNRKDLFVVDRRTKRVSFLSDSESPPSPPLPHSFNLPAPLFSSSAFAPFLAPSPRHLLRQFLLDSQPEGVSKVYGSWSLLAIQRDLMVVCCSSPNTPPTLRVGFLAEPGQPVTWRTLQEPVTFDLHWRVLDVCPTPEEDNACYSGLEFGGVLVKPLSSRMQIPLVVFIHGGPHSQFPAEWNIVTVGLAKLGFAVLMVNYRGSTGFGQDSIQSLIGHIGNQDVKDVQRAVLTALQSDVTLDPERLAVIGGSHGGFLSCHMVGQYPDFYRACAARNPVINAATLLGTSDIVDWRYSSVGLSYCYDQLPTAEALSCMLERSPITHAGQIRAPVLLMLGARDRRVSPHQGLELYRALRSRASPVRLLWFPEDGHSLGRVDTQADCFINTVLWLQEHL